MPNRYPRIFIRSKNELAKHIHSKKFSKEKALSLINDVLLNRDSYWKDSKRSNPAKGKYVRNAKGTPLGSMLRRINVQVLGPHDALLPGFIFGGLKGSNHVKAVLHLQGTKRKRVLLKLDITRFFEQVGGDRVRHFFQDKCKCSYKAAKILSDICCVPLGPKGSDSTQKTIGRGFATSSRLAVWCNLDVFLRLDRLVQERLRGKDPRIAIYVDDIGITASRISKEEMEALLPEIKNILLNSDPNQALPLNDEKTEVISHEEGMEHLGLRMYKNRLSLGSKTLSKRDKLRAKLKKSLSPKERARLRKKYQATARYKGYVENLKLTP